MINSSVRMMVAELLIAFFVIVVVAKSQATWDIMTHPVVLGENILLRCTLPNSTCNENSTSQWNGGPSYKFLGINDASMNKSKYKIIRNNSLSSFYIDLLIYNVSYSDLNHDYTCSCNFSDFTKNLTVRRNNLFALPSTSTTSDSSAMVKNGLLINITLENVNPEPNCSVQFRGRSVVNNVNFTKQQTSDLFYKVQFVQVIPDMESQQSRGNCHYKIICTVSNYTITISERYLKNCKADEHGLLLPVIIASSFIFLLIVALLICSRNRTRLPKCRQCVHRKVYKTAKGLTSRNSELNLCVSQSIEKAEQYDLTDDSNVA